MRPGRLLAVCMVLAACGPKSNRGEGRYALGNPGDGWRRVDPGGADQAWFSGALSGSIYADSNCGSRFEDGPLPDLASHLTWGVVEMEPLQEEELILDERAAYIRVSRGQVDGVAVQLGIMVTKKNDCLYDVLYIAPPATFQQGWADFVTVLQGFRTEG